VISPTVSCLSQCGVATFEGEDLRGTRYVDCRLDGAEFREVTLVGARFVGSVLIDVEIDALVENLTVNGVDVVPLVEAELDRRHPERLALRPTDVEDSRAALDVVNAFWSPVIELVRSLPENIRYQRVADEWSLVETLRHLLFVYDAWFGRAVARRQNRMAAAHAVCARSARPPLVACSSAGRCW
jgi:hypothetical protein